MPLFDLSDVIASLPTGSYTLIRRVAGGFDPLTGKVLPAVETEVQLTDVTVLPEPSLANDELKLRAGSSSDDRLMAWVPIAQLAGEALRASDPTTGQMADRIIYGGKIYEVTDSLDWSEAGGYSQARFGIYARSVEGAS